MPVVRQLCQKMSAPTAPHHIFAGVASILSSSDSDTENELNISALIVALFLLVTTRLAGVRMQPAEYTRQKRLVLEVLKEFVGEDTERKNVDDADVIECTKQFKDQHWIEMDWFGNIPMGSGLDMTEGPKEIGDDVSRDDEAEETLLLPAEMTGARRLDSADQDYLQAGLVTMVSSTLFFFCNESELMNLRCRIEWTTSAMIADMIIRNGRRTYSSRLMNWREWTRWTLRLAKIRAPNIY